MATIRYFLPADGDNEDTPNVFLAPKPSRPGYPPLLGQIKGSFPLPGSYHFRFKSPLVPGSDRDKHAVAVWMDCVDDNAPVPMWQNSIIAKVTRISLDDNDEVAVANDFARPGVTGAESNVSAASVPSAQPRATTETYNNVSNHSSDSLLGAFDEPLVPTAPTSSAASSVHSSSENLLDVDHHHVPAPASGGSLLDMDHLGSPSVTTSSGANTPTSDHHELLNMSAPMPSQPSRPMPPVSGGMMMSQSQQQPQQQQRQQPMQQHHGRPPQPTPMQMQGQYPMQYPPQGQYAAQGMSQLPPPQQQQQQQQQRNMQNGGNRNAFDKFSGSSLDPLGSLNWNMK
ncbi:hypothetical protein ACHAXH_002716 [Discostella pseudostelligera]